MILGLTFSEAARAGWRVRRLESDKDYGKPGKCWLTLWKEPVDSHSVTVELTQEECLQALETIPWYGLTPLEVA